MCPRSQTNRSLSRSGTAFIAIGVIAALGTGAGIVTRVTTGITLAQSTPPTIEADAQMRLVYSIGITLRVLGDQRTKKDFKRRHGLAVRPGPTLLRLDF